MPSIIYLFILLLLHWWVKRFFNQKLHFQHCAEVFCFLFYFFFLLRWVKFFSFFLLFLFFRWVKFQNLSCPLDIKSCTPNYCLHKASSKLQLDQGRQIICSQQNPFRFLQSHQQVCKNGFFPNFLPCSLSVCLFVLFKIHCYVYELYHSFQINGLDNLIISLLINIHRSQQITTCHVLMNKCIRNDQVKSNSKYSVYT